MRQSLSDYSFEVKKEQGKRILAILFFFVVVFALVSLVRAFLIFPVRERSLSMMPDIPENSVVMVTPLVRSISRGNVVLLSPRENKNLSLPFRALDFLCRLFSAQQYSPFEAEERAGSFPVMRRIVALPGDTISMRGFVLSVRPAGESHALSEFELFSGEPYNVTIEHVNADWDDALAVSGRFDERRLGEDEYFVLGDTRTSAFDSRLWGAVKKSDIIAKGLFVCFPFSQFRVL